MVELICDVARHVYIEQCIDMLNVFKVSYKGHRATFSWVLPGIFIGFTHVCHIDLFKCDWPMKAWIASLPNGAKAIR